MKLSHLVAVLAGLVAVAVLAADASAFYHPGLGGWMSRDPGPESGDAVRVGATGPAAGEGFLPRDAASGTGGATVIDATTPSLSIRFALPDRRPESAMPWRATQIVPEKQPDRHDTVSKNWTAQYSDGMNLYGYVRSSPLVYLDPTGLSVKCGTISMQCKSGTKTWDVYGCSKRAKFILGGGSGCVTLLIPKAIFCTGPCDAIKGWQSAGNPNVNLLEHEACHACAFEDGGFFDYLGTWIPGDITDPKYCDKHPVPSSPNW